MPAPEREELICLVHAPARRTTMFGGAAGKDFESGFGGGYDTEDPLAAENERLRARLARAEQGCCGSCCNNVPALSSICSWSVIFLLLFFITLAGLGLFMGLTYDGLKILDSRLVVSRWLDSRGANGVTTEGRYCHPGNHRIPVLENGKNVTDRKLRPKCVPCPVDHYMDEPNNAPLCKLCGKVFFSTFNTTGALRCISDKSDITLIYCSYDKRYGTCPT